jgi:hypothetical protein
MTTYSDPPADTTPTLPDSYLNGLESALNSGVFELTDMDTENTTQIVEASKS